MKNHNNIAFPSNTDPDTLKHQKAAKPAFNVGPSPARHNALERAIRDDDNGIWIISILIN